MCSVVILRRPGHSWPVIVGANRDEMANRPWRPPGRHWTDRPQIFAGQDLLAEGSWLGLNDDGVVAALLNRHGSLGPAEGRRSRGELTLEALDHADATEAARALTHLNPRAYRPFNLLICDDQASWLLCCRNDTLPIEAIPLAEGLSMITAFDLNDSTDTRIRIYRPRFAAATPPDPDHDIWNEWTTQLADRDGDLTAQQRAPQHAMCFSTSSGFGTSSSALIALPSRAAHPPRRPFLRFAAGPPDQASWEILMK
ncbi:conserved hypothetical protein [Azospirillaceae bacterium]